MMDLSRAMLQVRERERQAYLDVKKSSRNIYVGLIGKYNEVNTPEESKSFCLLFGLIIISLYYIY